MKIRNRYLNVIKFDYESDDDFWQRFLRTCQSLLENDYTFIVTDEGGNCIRIEFTDACKELDVEVPYMVFQDEIDVIETAREHHVPISAVWKDTDEECEVKSFWEDNR